MDTNGTIELESHQTKLPDLAFNIADLSLWVSFTIPCLELVNVRQAPLVSPQAAHRGRTSLLPASSSLGERKDVEPRDGRSDDLVSWYLLTIVLTCINHILNIKHLLNLMVLDYCINKLNRCEEVVQSTSCVFSSHRRPYV